MSMPSFTGSNDAAAASSLASPGLRIVARFIDSIILGIISGILGTVVGAGFVTAGRAGKDGVGAGKLFLAALLGIAVGFVYDAVLTSKIGGTPMKKVLGMRVVDAASGQPVALNQAGIRWAIPGVFSIVPVLGGLVGFVVLIISLVFLFSDKLRQTVSDKVAKTVVVKG